MEGVPAQDLLSFAPRQAAAEVFLKQAREKASVGEFEAAEGFLWRAAGFFYGFAPTTDDDSPYIREAANQQACVPGGCGYLMTGKSIVNPLPHFGSILEQAKAKWEEGAPARAVEWEKAAPQRRAAEEIARLKAEIARVEQEEVDRQAALAKEALEKLRLQKEEEQEKQRKAELTSLERDVAALREKLSAMKELMAMKAADPIAYAAVCAAPPPFQVQDFMSKAQYRKLRETNGFPLNSDQHVCHIISESNGGADHIDNYYVAAGSLNQSLGNRNDFYLAEAAGLEQTKKAVLVSRSRGYTGPGAEELIAMARTARSQSL
jgi:hypothetical protein